MDRLEPPSTATRRLEPPITATRRRITFLAIAVAAVAGVVLSAGLVSRQHSSLISTGRERAAPTSSLEYFANLGYQNTEKCDGSLPSAEQSPVAIDTGVDWSPFDQVAHIVPGDVGNVVKSRLPPWGWVQTDGLNGLYRMKTPGTDMRTGAPNVKAFVQGNKFDMSEAAVHATYGGVKYDLDHFVLKTPSEHTINGETFDMEQQFVHYPAAGEEGAYKALIVSVMYKENPLNSPQYIEEIYHAIPCMGEGKHCQRVISFASMARTILYQTPSKFGRLTYSYDPTDICKAPPCVYGGSVGDSMVSLWVPPSARANFRSFFRYTGSRTTPPCQEEVQWLVLNNPIPIQTKHMAALQLALGDIARPTQPLNGRVLEESTSHFWT